MNDYLFYSEKYCKFCLENKSNSHICDDCIERLEFIDGINELDDGVCYYPLFYNNYIKSIIKRFKYSDHTYLVKPLCEILYKYYNSKGLKFDYISFVPMTPKDEYIRGYNQSYLLADYLSKYINVDIIELANKVKSTKSQNKLDRLARETNLLNSFNVIKGLKINGKSILIIDDLVTTGSTFNTLAREIKSVYNVKISFLAVASSKMDID